MGQQTHELFIAAYQSAQHAVDTAIRANALMDNKGNEHVDAHLRKASLQLRLALAYPRHIPPWEKEKGV